jgi:hypothetical protein
MARASSLVSNYSGASSPFLFAVDSVLRLVSINYSLNSAIVFLTYEV